MLPTIEDSLAFVADYEAARRAPFSADERRALTAAARYATAYTARCEHSIDPQGQDAGKIRARATLRAVVDGFQL
jgi:hypothetical protein